MEGGRVAGRATALLVALAIIAAACAPSPPSVTPTPAPGSQLPVPSGGEQQPSGSGGEQPAGATLPKDVVADVDRLLGAATTADAEAAARVMLEHAGVVITDDPGSGPRSPAGIYLSPEELTIIAAEGHDRADGWRVTYAEFASTFGGVALLPPNDALLAGIEPGALTPGPLAGTTRSNLDLKDQPGRLATFLAKWVSKALAVRNPSDPDLVLLTDAPLYLAALAARQRDPVDLTAAFAPSELRLTGLDLALLTAGMRVTLAVAAGGRLATSLAPATAVLAGAEPCDTLKSLIDNQVPLVTDVGSVAAGQAIGSLVQSFVEGLFGTASTAAQVIGPAMSALGIIFRVLALAMLYSHAEAKVEVEPTTLHKPTSGLGSATAKLTVGVPDAEWEAAKQQRANSPFATAVKNCAGQLGVPVTSDLVDIGQATASWRARWDIVRGSPEHAYFAAGAFDVNGTTAGNNTRPLKPQGDHKGQDSVPISITAERQRDHPGTQVERPVRVCAWVQTVAPPNIQLILNAGIAGSPLGGASSLAAVIADLLTSWWQFSHEIKACGEMTVSFHVPKPGTWHGTITVNTEVQQHSASSVVEPLPLGKRDVTTGSTRTSADVTDEFFVAGNDPVAGSPFVQLQARQYTHGVWHYVSESYRDGYDGTGCHGGNLKKGDYFGTWSFDADTTASILIDASGHYSVNWNAQAPPAEVTAPGADSTSRTDLGGGSAGCEGAGTETRPGSMYPSPTVATLDASAEGQLDPANPGTVLNGSLGVTNFDGSMTTITWNLQHEGPIPIGGGDF
jgi:hypothetical protein